MRAVDLYRKGRELAPTAESSDLTLLFEADCGMDRTGFYAHPDREIPEETAALFLEHMKRRSKGEPVQRILGHASFMGYDFFVGENVLIPRQETEILVEEVLKRLDRADSLPIPLLDMCTGTGCIAVSLMLAKDPRTLCVTACDIAPEALAVAKRNRQRYNIPEEQLILLHSDLFEQVSGSYRIIVSNPPYIPTGVIPSLSREVREYDPHTALDGGTDGLNFYRRLTEKAPLYLHNHGILAREIGHDQGDAVKALMIRNGFGEIEIIRDLAEHDRVIIGTKEEQHVR